MEYEKILGKYDYAELRIESSKESCTRIKDGEVKNSTGNSYGMSVRVLSNGSWGFASSNNRADLEKLLNKAERLSRLSGGTIKLRPPNPEKKRICKNVQIADSGEKVKRLADASKGMEAGSITSRMLSCTDSVVTKEFCSSLGADILQEYAYAFLQCTAIARSGEIIERGSDRSWSRNGFEKLKIEKTAESARDKALRLVSASPPPQGRFTVVLDPEMTGVFSHEALGHACEGDSVVDRESVLSDKKGRQIGNALVSVVDDPTAQDFGHYVYDDEGVKAEKTPLVEKGVLQTYLNSMETAERLDCRLNGHARAESYAEVPIVRMSNTYFQPGESRMEEVFDIPKGIYLKGMKGGSVDIFSGGFMFKAEEAYEIANGERGKIMRDVTITGNVLQTMHNVECVGRDFGTSPGICGKFSQEVPVSDGGPHIRIRDMLVG
ncbi:TldD/PmbA family protein [Candidatus Micrarchaeota archaeon]|nr:TldD/PmbA family protein [Candidatus Micrarchaeota archaeon]